MMKRKQTGITMIEVLVTVLVLTIGLAGVMTMETVAIETNHQSYLRTQAILQAQEMADRMHANPNGVTDGHYATAIPSAAPRSCLTNSCSTQQMAEFDKWEWEQGTKKHLPAGAGSISYPASLDSTIAVPAVFLYRLFTFWVPILPGWIAFQWLEAKEYI